MCEPTTIMLAISAVSAAATYVQQDAAADAQAESVQKANDLQQMDLQRQSDQQREAAAAQMNEQARAAARDSALFDAVTGEYGGGNTASRAATVGSIQQGEQLATLTRNAEMRAGENSISSMATNYNTQAKLASIQRPSGLGTVLTIAGAAAGAYQGGAFDGLKSKPKLPAANSSINYTPSNFA